MILAQSGGGLPKSCVIELGELLAELEAADEDLTQRLGAWLDYAVTYEGWLDYELSAWLRGDALYLSFCMPPIRY